MIPLLMLTATTIGVLLVLRGAIGRVEGWEPHCRQCGFCLSGLTDAPDLRCPECERTVGAPVRVRHGVRVRKRSLIVIGSVLLVFPAAPIVRSAVIEHGGPAFDSILSDRALAERCAFAMHSSSDVQTGPIDEVQRRILAGDFAESAITHVLLAAQSSSERFLPRLLAGDVRAARLSDAALRRLVHGMTAAQESTAGGLRVTELTLELDAMLATPGLSLTTREAIIEFALAWVRAERGRTSAVVSGLEEQLVEALRAGHLSGNDLARIIDAAVTVELTVGQADDLWSGDTARIAVKTSLGPLENIDLPFAITLDGDATSEPFQLHGGAVSPLAARQAVPFRQGLMSAWLTLPDDPGVHTVEVEVVHSLHGRGIDLLDRFGIAFTDIRPDHAETRATMEARRRVSVELTVLDQRAAAPRVRSAEESESAPTLENVRVWSDASAELAVVAFIVSQPEVAIAGDVFVRHAGGEDRIGWAYAPVATDSDVVVSGTCAGLREGDAVEVIIRPSIGPLRAPRRASTIHGAEIVIPVTVVAPNQTTPPTVNPGAEP